MGGAGGAVIGGASGFGAALVPALETAAVLSVFAGPVGGIVAGGAYLLLGTAIGAASVGVLGAAGGAAEAGIEIAFDGCD